MAKYTTELRHVVEQAEKDATGSYTPFSYTEASYKAVGLDAYPIFDEGYRASLNDKIIDHFYMREIGAETVGLFRLFVMRTMNEQMPYFNELYEKQAMLIDPFIDYEHSSDEKGGDAKTSNWSSTANETGTSDATETNDVTSEETGNVETTDTAEDVTDTVSGTKGTNTGSEHVVFSDTPMSMLTNQGSPSVENLDYATNATFTETQGSTEDSSSSNVKSNRDSTGTETSKKDVTETSKKDANQKTTRDTDETGERKDDGSWWKTLSETGRNQTQSELYQKYMAAWRNIDMMIIDALEPCFMQVYGWR